MLMKSQHYSSLHSTSRDLYELTDEDVERLHEILLDMYKDLESVCSKRKVHLIAAGGSCLGAIRHKGFIPWDDDMDLFMFRSDFRRFQSFFEEEFGDRYILLAPGSKNGANCFLPRIFKKGTTMLNMIDETAPYPHGIYIDINIIEYAPASPALFKAKSLAADALRFISYSVYWAQYPSSSMRDFMMNSEGANYYRLRMAVGKAFSFMKAETWFSLFDRFVQGRRSDVITVPSGARKYKGEKLPLEVMRPLKRTAFEDTKIFVPGDYDAYLKNLYGDYMKIPDQDKREHHLCLKLDFEHE